MNDKMKIKQQAGELQKWRDAATHINGLLSVCIDALSYIVKGEEQEKKVIYLLDNVGVPKGDEAVPPKQVAQECLVLVNEMNQEFREKRDVPRERSDSPETVQLMDGEEIIFTTEFDALFHRCCGCGLVHEVHLEWDFDKTGNDMEYRQLKTKWYRRDDVPTAEEIESRGDIIKREGLQ